MTYSEIIKNNMINVSDKYSSMLNEIIKDHNISIDSFSQTVTHLALFLALKNKGIITDDEYNNAVEEVINIPVIRYNIKALQDNANSIKDLIELEKCDKVDM